jgi:hypothetical protein
MRGRRNDGGAAGASGAVRRAGHLKDCVPVPEAASDPTPPPAELLALFRAFLVALGDPQAGEALYHLHAPDAALRFQEHLRPAAQVDVTAFAHSHREISLHAAAQLPAFELPVLHSAHTDAGSANTIAWFELTETRSQQHLLAALGVHPHAGVQRIAWCTLAARIEGWKYHDGLLQSLADFPWMHSAAAGAAAARCLLDASYFRQYRRTAVSFSTLPDARFSCQMSSACCRHDFEITLPPDAQLIIDAMPWQTLRPQLAGTQLAVRPDGKLQLKALDEACRFLGAHRQCLVHQTLGRQPFGPCAVFPFSFAHTPEGIAVSLSPICGSTRLGIGIAPAEREADLRERLVHTRPRQTDAYRLTPQIEIPWQSFRDIEKALRECLAAPELPMRRRLYVGARLLGALSRNQPLDADGWLSEPPLAISAELRAAIHGMLGKILGWDRAVLRSLPATLPAELSRLEVRDTAIVVRIMHNVLFSKVYSYPFDLTTAYNLLIVLYLLTLIMQASSDGPLPDAMWQELGSLGVHGLLSNVLHEGVPQGFRALLGSSEFGQWALAA